MGRAMERHTPQARQILRKVLHGRVMVQPTPEREDCYAEITATATIGKVLAGTVIVPRGLASPTGLAATWYPVIPLIGYASRSA